MGPPPHLAQYLDSWSELIMRCVDDPAYVQSDAVADDIDAKWEQGRAVLHRHERDLESFLDAAAAYISALSSDRTLSRLSLDTQVLARQHLLLTLALSPAIVHSAASLTICRHWCGACSWTARDGRRSRQAPCLTCARFWGLSSAASSRTWVYPITPHDALLLGEPESVIRKMMHRGTWTSHAMPCFSLSLFLSH